MSENPLRRERLEIGAPLGTVAALAGMHDSLLCKFERGVVPVSRAREEKLRNVLRRLRAIVEESPYPVDLRDVNGLKRVFASQATDAA